MEDDDRDRISRLPDCLLVEILSRLPETIYAVRTRVLSKRWKHIWTYVPNLVFIHYIYLAVRPRFFYFVDKTLTQRGESKIKEFKVECRYDCRFESQVEKWIHYAIRCNAEKLTLDLVDFKYEAVAFPLGQLILNNSCFTDLTLGGCSFNPTGAISWKNLRRLSMSDVKLDEDHLIENILQGSPVLETLKLSCCYGYKRLNIASKSVKNLVISGYAASYRQAGNIVEINAPNILSLTIQNLLSLVRILLQDVSSLVEAHLDYAMYSTSPPSYDPKKAEEETLKGLLLSLVHVKEIEIGRPCLFILDRLEAQGFISPTNLTRVYSCS